MSGDDSIATEVLAAPVGIGMLAATGATWGWVVGAAAVLVAVGVLLVRFGRRPARRAHR